MRIHTDTLTYNDLYDAARIARVSFGGDTPEQFGSRSRDHAFEILLRGESNRAPNYGTGERQYGEHAATWDQWGVFLSVLFDKDNGETFEPSAPMTTTRYVDRAQFDMRTDGRFIADEDGNYWPTDAHGDHTFRFNGTPGASKCTKCSAIQRWL